MSLVLLCRLFICSAARFIRLLCKYSTRNEDKTRKREREIGGRIYKKVSCLSVYRKYNKSYHITLISLLSQLIYIQFPSGPSNWIYEYRQNKILGCSGHILTFRILSPLTTHLDQFQLTYCLSKFYLYVYLYLLHVDMWIVRTFQNNCWKNIYDLLIRPWMSFH